jgi:hypothetical protein
MRQERSRTNPERGEEENIYIYIRADREEEENERGA